MKLFIKHIQMSKLSKKIGLILNIVIILGCNHHGKILYKYYPDGKVMLKFYSKANKYNDSVFYLYTPNGNLKSIQTIRKGLLQDTSWIYMDDGPLIQKAVYDSGKLNGLSFNYFENGALASIGSFKNDLQTGEWLYFDSLHSGQVLKIRDYFILHNKSIKNKYITFFNDSAHKGIKAWGYYYNISSKISAIINTDTIYTFIINVICHFPIDKGCRVIYGNLGDDFSNLSKADTINSYNDEIIIPDINIKKAPGIEGIIQFYHKSFSPQRGDTLIDAISSYFYFKEYVR